MIMSCICIACGKKSSAQNEDSSENNLEMVIGRAEEREIVLDADKVPDCSLEQKYVNKRINNIFYIKLI